jgi:hypothetical protein
MFALVAAAASALVAADAPSLAEVPPAPPVELPAPEPDDDADMPTAHPARPYVRTTLETTLLLAAGTLWYWRSPSYSDWDLKFDWQSWKSKLFSDRDIVFDDNRFDTNALNHPVAGALYYQMARGNGFSVGASFVSSFLASTAWEYFVEFNEKPSINDLILTPLGGAVIGEATYRLGRLFYEGRPGFGNCLGAIVFSPVATLNDAAVCRAGHGEPPYDPSGFSRRLWHRVTIEAGRTRTMFDAGGVADETSLGFGAEVVAHRPYQRPGEGITTVHPGQWSLLTARALFGDGAVRGSAVHAHTVILGRYLRRYAEADEPDHGPTDGWGLMFGAGSTFDYDARDLTFDWDRTVSAGVAGPMLELAARRGNLTLRAWTTATYAFSLVDSLAYPTAAPALAGQFIKSELRQQGYYYAQGVTTASALVLEYRAVSLLFDGRTGWFRSFDAGDRYQGRIQNNFSLTDTRVFLRATATVRPFAGPLRFALGVDRTNRESRLLAYAASVDETRVGLAGVLAF